MKRPVNRKEVWEMEMYQHCTAQSQNTVKILNVHVFQAVPAVSKDRISRTWTIEQEWQFSFNFFVISFRIHCKFLWMPSLTVVLARTRPVSGELVQFVDRPLMFLLCVVSTRLSGCCAQEQERLRSEISSPLLNVWPMNWSMLLRYTSHVYCKLFRIWITG
jgi:hypothetical protein